MKNITKNENEKIEFVKPTFEFVLSLFFLAIIISITVAYMIYR